MPELPQQVNVSLAAGGPWPDNYTLTNDDGTPLDLSTATFEFVIRPSVTDAAHPALIQVTSSGSNAQGVINVAGNVVTVDLYSTATVLLGQGARPYALWMDPGGADAEPIVVGTVFSQLVAAA